MTNNKLRQATAIVTKGWIGYSVKGLAICALLLGPFISGIIIYEVTNNKDLWFLPLLGVAWFAITFLTYMLWLFIVGSRDELEE